MFRRRIKIDRFQLVFQRGHQLCHFSAMCERLRSASRRSGRGERFNGRYTGFGAGLDFSRHEEFLCARGDFQIR